jgi:hypothetical protein
MQFHRFTYTPVLMEKCGRRSDDRVMRLIYIAGCLVFALPSQKLHIISYIGETHRMYIHYYNVCITCSWYNNK